MKTEKVFIYSKYNPSNPQCLLGSGESKLYKSLGLNDTVFFWDGKSYIKSKIEAMRFDSKMKNWEYKVKKEGEEIFWVGPKQLLEA